MSNMQSFRQLLPAASLDAAQEWRLQSDLLNNHLALQGNNPGWYCRSFNPYPFAVNADHYRLQQALQKALHKAIKLLVQNYFIDRRLQQLINLPESATELLQLIVAREPEYAVGSYRPDFLHALDDNIQICEINARFPVNGYFISHYLHQATRELCRLEGHADGIGRTMDQMLNCFISRFAPGSKVSLWKGRERGWDIHFFNYELKRLGYEIVPVAGGPSGLVLELHQDEILSPVACRRVAELVMTIPQRFWLNDLRTIFLIHDKRFLALFRRFDILADYLEAEQIELLTKHVAPTYVLSQAMPQVEEALEDPKAWLLKPNLLGKGEGILFGGKVSAKQWRDALTDPAHQDYVLQKLVVQKRFPILHQLLPPHTQESAPESIEMNVVGTLLCLDDNFFGPGIYRASSGDIVNVSGGGTILYPVVSS